MAWKIVRNKDYTSRDTYHRGECPRFKENATLSIHLSGKQVSKYDLQPSFFPQLKECSLLNEKHEKDSSCMFGCRCFEEYKNSHSY